MQRSQFVRWPLLTLVSVVFLAACGDGNQQESLEAAGDHPTQGEVTERVSTLPQPDSLTVSRPASLRIEYGYGGHLGVYGIADTAKAYDGSRLVAEAKSAEIIQRNPGPNRLLVDELHYADSGEVIYRGQLVFEFWGNSARVVEEHALEGRKVFDVFSSWPAGS